MAADDLINFDEIEPHKENIQRVQGGRSARALAAVLSPKNVDNALKPIPSDQEKINNVKRQEFEQELETIDESDDPLDVYDRYVKWTFDTYPNPTSQQSQLLPLLERATKAFLKSPHYKNDPRYLKLWLNYIKLFSDEPRQTFAFLARHNIGDGLALFYEEFAAYLETQGRWNQAEEVFSMGVDKEAHPSARLLRKYGEFQQRMEAHDQDNNGPSSPALPVVRAALADKGDATGSPNPQGGPSGAAPKKKAKMAIFADTEEPKQSVLGGTARKGESIQTMAERKKENKQEAQAWAGQKLNGGKRNVGAEKLMIFKDQSLSESLSAENSAMREAQQTVNMRTGKIERVFVNLEAVYPNADDPMAAEFCFEELRARHRGWMQYDWKAINRQDAEKRKQERARKEQKERNVLKPKDPQQSPMKDPAAMLAKSLQQSVALNDVNDENAPPSQEEIQRAKMLKKQRKEERANRTRKIKVMEVQNETQTIRANLGSPTGHKPVRRKKTAEPTMTINTKEAMDEIYGIFNQPLKETKEESEEEESEEESDDDDTYTSGGESTCTGRMSGTESEYGDETTQGDFTVKSAMDDDDDTNASRASAWSEFTESRLVPRDEESEASGSEEGESEDEASGRSTTEAHDDEGYGGSQEPEDLHTPTSPEHKPAALPTRYVPVPPEDVEVPRRTYRDQVQMANNRLPFMTPIAEKTESSIGAATVLAEQKDFFNAKTPSRQSGGKTPTILEDETEDLSGSFNEILEEALKENGGRMAQPALPKPKDSKSKPAPLGISKSAGLQETKDVLPKGPIIQDKQCNPVDEQIRQTILENVHPPVSSYDGYHADIDRSYGRHAEIKKFTKAIAKAKSGGEKTGSSFVPPTIYFDGGDREYTIKRQLGEGAFAPVYLAESKTIGMDVDEDEGPAQMGKGAFGAVTRKPLEAIKMEDPPSAWEFYIIRQAHRRMGVSRAAESIIHAYEMRMFRDECYLVLEYRDQGTLLDLVNVARAEVTTGGAGVMDEQLAMFFSIELLRTVEALHAKGIIHGDLKADNVLARLDTPLPDGQWSSQYSADGSGGWSRKGISLIDLGRGIDMRAFKPDVQFVADWKTTEADCAEMREMRPWTFQVDYHGLAATIHSLLFGKYIETVAERGAVLGAGATKTYRLRENFKRYWQTELWGELFDLLLNPTKWVEQEEGQRLPVLRGMKRCREGMEKWLEANCERGVGLKGLVRRMEERVGGKKGRQSY